MVLTSGQIDWWAQEYFGRFACFGLSGAVASYTGWPVLVVEAQYSDGTWHPVHSAARTPGDTVLEIFGDTFVESMLARYREALDAPVRPRLMPSSDLPGAVISGMQRHRGDDLWWARELPKAALAAYEHFARLLLTRHGYGHYLPASLPAPGTPPAAHQPAPTRGATSHPDAAPSPPSSGGSTAMSGIDEIRHALLSSTEKSRYAQGALAQAIDEIEQITQLLQQAAGSSTQPAIQEATGTYARARDELEQLRGLLHTGAEAIESYASQL
ncbi:hypothetical protein [Actinopolyspora xinjiangensis]|uniref:hypothetical protein n=1 Tax=Actinopolyspora xinjiangensis TaxID=405564 RepID=UPI0011134434|nr:hypothetical protein [Actinopolyspora xinjiangensis]